MIGSCFAMAGFAVAILAGLSADLNTAQILQRAVVAMIFCYPVGMIAGMICQRVVDNHVAAHHVSNPTPSADGSERLDATVASDDEKPIIV